MDNDTFTSIRSASRIPGRYGLNRRNYLIRKAWVSGENIRDIAFASMLSVRHTRRIANGEL